MISAISSSSSSYLEYLAEIRQRMMQSVETTASGAIDYSEMSSLIKQSTASLLNSDSNDLSTNQGDLISMISSSSVLANLAQQMKFEGSGMDSISGMPPPPPPDKVFDTADKNSDGSITKDELSSVIGQGSADKVFSKIDTDGNNLISRAEDKTFQESMAGVSGMPPPPPKPEQVFDIADTNKDGIVSLEELAALIGQGNADKLFGKIDTDGDSLISRSEDKAFRSNMLEEMQKNNAENTTDLNKVNSLSTSNYNYGYVK